MSTFKANKNAYRDIISRDAEGEQFDSLEDMTSFQDALVWAAETKDRDAQKTLREIAERQDTTDSFGAFEEACEDILGSLAKAA